MKKEMEAAYEKLPKLLNKFNFSKAYIRNDNDSLTIVLFDQKHPLSLSQWFDFETFIKLDISRNINLLGYEQIENLDGYLLIKGSENND